MNCWKSININKEFGLNRLYLLSFLISLAAFIFLYMPFSMIHGETANKDFGIIPLIIALFSLPTIHSLMHILPLIMMNKRAKLIFKRKNKWFPIVTYYTKKHLTKKASIVVAMAPTLLLTIPGLMGSFLFADYYVYFLVFTAVHIGFTFTDFLYVINILQAPKHSYIENSNDEISILIKAHD
ncbi:DUF3267 domain-containing protein [Virgibacillus siamensis]|uniref:DUF3267 domain-containing protein n=1 Tax=Virgibacillus siamensis TaxID=480071 RepID=UPI0009846450|nr:DUF3267 domain-containing protein [Virgibacillus siamensis]